MKTKVREDFQSRVKLSLVMLIVGLVTTKRTSSRNPPYLSSQYEVLTIVTLLNLRHSFLKRYTHTDRSLGRERKHVQAAVGHILDKVLYPGASGRGGGVT